MKTSVSVIIPAYNASKFIIRSIGSVLGQTHQNFELFVVDDYSTDGTFDLVTKMFGNNHKIVVLRNERKKGPSGARNTGVLKANGEYIAFLDADDSWYPNHLKQGIEYLASFKFLDAIFFDFNIIESESNHIKNNWYAEKTFVEVIKKEFINENLWKIDDNLFYALLNESFIQLQSLIVRKYICDDVLFDEEIMRAEDLDFAIKLYLQSQATFAYSNIITGNYYRHRDSLTTQNIDNGILTIRDHVILFSKYLNKHADDQYALDKLNRILYDKHLNLSYCYRVKENHVLALKHLWNSFRYGGGFQQIKELAKIAASILITSRQIPIKSHNSQVCL